MFPVRCFAGEHFADYSTPEIQRIALDSTLLQVLACGNDPRAFPFIDAPTPEARPSPRPALDPRP